MVRYHPLIEMPPGDFSNMFDYQAFNMAAAHNTFIQGVNALIRRSCGSVLHWYDEPLYIILRYILHFICAFQLETIHHHHTLEETFYFPALEEKLGKGALSGNIEDHEEFVPKLDALDEWCKKVQKGEVVYDGNVFLEMVEAFADTMVAHMTNSLPLSVVCANPSTPWFPPIPASLKWATRWWFSRRYSAAWEFGPLDFSGNERIYDHSS